MRASSLNESKKNIETLARCESRSRGSETTESEIKHAARDCVHQGARTIIHIVKLVVGFENVPVMCSLQISKRAKTVL
jgi:hypothetical protein